VHWTRRRHWWVGSCRNALPKLRLLLEARLNKGGRREYVQVLRLLETCRLEEVTPAVEHGLAAGTISFDAVKHLLLCQIERVRHGLDLENYPPPCRQRSFVPHRLGVPWSQLRVNQ